MMRLIDTHCHINFQAFENDWKEVTSRTLKSSTEMIIVSTDLKTSLRAIEIAKLYSGVYAAVGFHPIHVLNRDWRSEIIHILDLIKDPNVVAIGEIGFDRYRLPDDQVDKALKLQERVFDFFLEEAKKADKPVIIHNREAMDILMRKLPAIKKMGLRGVQHCYPGNLTQAKKLFEAGFKVGFTGLITYNDKWDDYIKKIDLENILIETDSPYLTPIPHRGARNEPINVKYVASHIAKLKNIAVEEVINQTYINAKSLFKLT